MFLGLNNSRIGGRKTAALHHAASVLLAFFAVTLLGLITLMVYLASSKAIGQGSNLISSVTGAAVAALAGYCLGRELKHRTDHQVDQLRAHEKDFYQRLDKEIRSILAKAS
jgi:predicted PurR-regulated permease PerM